MTSSESHLVLLSGLLLDGCTIHRYVSIWEFQTIDGLMTAKLILSGPHPRRRASIRGCEMPRGVNEQVFFLNL